jgi:transcriptional regulator with XRE-family HTH domain
MPANANGGAGADKPHAWREIGARVRHYREKNKKTLEQLSKAIGTQKGALSLMERGERDFGSERLVAAARFLGISPSTLVKDLQVEVEES